MRNIFIWFQRCWSSPGKAWALPGHMYLDSLATLGHRRWLVYLVYFSVRYQGIERSWGVSCYFWRWTFGMMENCMYPTRTLKILKQLTLWHMFFSSCIKIVSHNLILISEYAIAMNISFDRYTKTAQVSIRFSLCFSLRFSLLI